MQSITILVTRVIIFIHTVMIVIMVIITIKVAIIIIIIVISDKETKMHLCSWLLRAATASNQSFRYNFKASSNISHFLTIVSIFLLKFWNINFEKFWKFCWGHSYERYFFLFLALTSLLRDMSLHDQRPLLPSISQGECGFIQPIFHCHGTILSAWMAYIVNGAHCIVMLFIKNFGHIFTHLAPTNSDSCEVLSGRNLLQQVSIIIFIIIDLGYWATQLIYILYSYLSTYKYKRHRIKWQII